MAGRPSNNPPSPRATPVLIAGPTAVGKSAVALALAERLDGEIVTVDSMQVYCGLDIGTAKPSAHDRRRVPHHLIDVVELSQPFDAAQFARLARTAVDAIQQRGRVPILCGGTGLYFQAWIEGLGTAPPANAALRAELEGRPLSRLLAELERRDPVTFARIDRHNPRRVIRALEVIRLTGKPFSTQRAGWKAGVQTRVVDGRFGLIRSNADLGARIDARVETMFARGLVRETERLLERGLAANQTAGQAIGYRQVAGHLRGERTLEETIALVKLRTRQLAKRQLTWFRHQFACTWLNLPPDEDPETTGQRLAEIRRLKGSAGAPPLAVAPGGAR
jgi:tRNA dimethylallyltransferase